MIAMALSARPCTSLAVLSAALLFLLGVTAPAHAAPRWIEVRSPHFRVLSDSSSTDARNVANEFEQMRYVIGARFPSFQLDPGSPLTIVAARDEQTARELNPQIFKGRSSNLAGYFQSGWEKRFAVVRLDTFTQGREVVYHEYTHSILHANTHWMPLWLDEGMAEFYAYTRFEDKRILVGTPTQRYRALVSRTLLPVNTMLDITPRSPFYRDQDKTQLFYAEAWAMVHYMIFGPDMGGGKRLNQYFSLLQNRTDRHQAFVTAFGDPVAFDKGFDLYLRQFTLAAGIIPTDSSVDRKSFTERTLTPAETAYELGAIHIGLHDVSHGRPLITKAIELDPKLGGSHEELGFLDFAEGNDEEARAEWHTAFSLDPTLYRSLYAETMSGPPIRQQTSEQLAATLLALQHVIQLNRRFAPAYIEVAMLSLRQGNLDRALGASRQAEFLEPWRSGYHLLTAQILLDQGHGANAASFARYVANGWFGSDRNEAIELLQQVPADQRGPDPVPAPDLAPGLKTVSGTLTAVQCGDREKNRKFALTIEPEADHDAKPLSFEGEHFNLGFADTSWWGEDHFSSCHHLVGNRVVVLYTPKEPSGGDLAGLEIRDDPPRPPAALTTPPAAQATH